MFISFNIEYRTNWGEEVRILGDILELCNMQKENALTLNTVDGIHWTADISFTQSLENKELQYNVFIYQNG